MSANGTTARPQRRDQTWAVLLVILTIAAIVRIAGLGERPLSMDELWDLEVATGRGSAHLDLPVNQMMTAPPLTRLQGAHPWWAIWGNMERLTQPPLYFFILRGWLEVFGDSAISARTLSVVAALLAIVLLYDAVRLLSRSKTVALWTAAIMALAPPMIEYSQLVRQYTLLLLFAAAVWWAIAQDQMRTERRHLLVLSASLWGLLMTHYFAVAAVIAVALFFAITVRQRLRWQAMLAVGAAVMLWLVAWGPQLLRHVRRFSVAESTTEFLHRQTTGAARFVETLSDLGALPLRLILPLPQRHVPWAWIAGLALMALLMLAWRKRRREMLLPALWLLSTAGLLLVLDLARATIHLQVVRYALLAAPALYVLLAGVWGRGPFRHIVPAIVVAVCAPALMQPRQMEFDWREMARFIDEADAGRAPLLFMRHEQADWFVGGQVMSYQHESLLPAPRVFAVVAPPLPEALLAELRAHPHAWLVSFWEDPQSVTELARHFHAMPAPVPNFPPVVLHLTPR